MAGVEKRPGYDVTLVVQGREFRAHKSVLSAASLFFDSMFTCNMKEKDQPSVKIEQINASTMKLVLEFVYTGDVEVDGESALDLLTTANYLLMPKLEQRAVDALKRSGLNVSNCIESYCIAVDQGFIDLRCSAREFIQANFLAVSETEEFLELSQPDHLKEWLSGDDVVLGEEEDAFKIVLKWIESDESREREANFPELFQCVRLACISRDYFFSEIIPHKLVQDNPECLRIALAATRVMLRVSDEDLPRQDQRKCLRTHVNAVVIFGEQPGGILFCFFPEQNSWYRLHHLTDREFMHLNSCRGSLYITSPYMTTRLFDPLKNIIPMVRGPLECFDLMTTGALLGYFYLMGGIHGYGGDVKATDGTFRFDPDSNSWKKQTPLSEPKWQFVLVPHDKYLYAIGGLSSTAVPLDTVERFEPASNCWLGLARMAKPRARACGVALGESIFIFGGTSVHGQACKSCEKYCIGTNQWEQIASMPSCRVLASAVVFKGSIYVFGGKNAVFGRNHETFATYDAGNDKWEQRGNMPSGCQGHSSAAVLRFPQSALQSIWQRPLKG